MQTGMTFPRISLKRWRNISFSKSPSKLRGSFVQSFYPYSYVREHLFLQLQIKIDKSCQKPPVPFRDLKTKVIAQRIESRRHLLNCDNRRLHLLGRMYGSLSDIPSLPRRERLCERIRGGDECFLGRAFDWEKTSQGRDFWAVAAS